MTPLTIGSYDPPGNPIRFKKRPAKRFTVAGVKQLSGNKPSNRSSKGATKDDAERIVEPHDAVARAHT